MIFTTRGRKLEWLIFATTAVAFGYFHQGGGWNSNGRFAMIRAIAEKGEFSIDPFLIYERAKPEPSTELRRTAVGNAEFTTNGRTNVLVWRDTQGQAFPVNDNVEGRVAIIDPSLKAVEIDAGHNSTFIVSIIDATEIKRSQTTLPFDALAVGDVVKVRCSHDAQGRALAKTVILLKRDEVRDIEFVDLSDLAATGDLSFYQGHFYPNKAPGTSFIAVPAYWFIYQCERLIGANPDEWWTLTLNAWLASALSLGLLSAVGAVLIYHLAFAFSGGRALPSLFTALAFAFGTMFFPHATSFYEQTVGLLASFYFLYRVKTFRNGNAALCLSLFLGGLCASYAAITNYISAVAVIFLALYLLLAVRQKKGWLWFTLGLSGPFLLICAYNIACFGTPFTTNYRHQNPSFIGAPHALLGIFVLPRWDVLLTILFSPFRGLFFTSPVLLIGVAGLVWMFQDKNFRAEAWLFSAIIGFFILFNISFNGWDGGWTVVPRYLGPAVPFLALPVVFGFIRAFKTTCALAAVSIAIMLLITAVNPQVPSFVLPRPAWQFSPLTEYELPIFLTRRPGPLIRELQDQVVQYYDTALTSKGATPEFRRDEVQRFQQHIKTLIAEGQPAPLELRPTSHDPNPQYSIETTELPAITSPVSVNMVGVYDGSINGTFGSLGSLPARWNSFNAGELLFEQSRLSLLPLLFIDGALIWLALRIARKTDAAAETNALPGACRSC